jgi:glycerate kinase
MHYLICPDSFKGSLSAMEVALAIKEGIEKIKMRSQAKVKKP